MAMQAKQKGLLAVGGIGLLAFLMMGSKKASAAGKGTGTTGGTGTGTGGGVGTGEGEGTGGIGEPAGPNGCKPGLINKDGICIDPNQPNQQGGGGNGGGGGGSLKPSEIYISNKCDSFKFGDNTGESWWKNSGKNKATEWLKAGYDNLILIAYEMLRKNKAACFKDFPLQENFIEEGKEPYIASVELQKARFDWIQKYPMMWALLNAIRNFIDRDLLDGVTYVKMDPKTFKLSFGKKFDINKYWEYIKPMAFYIANNEISNPGSMMKKVGLSYPGYNKDFQPHNVLYVLYTIIFPYVLDKASLDTAVKQKKLDTTTFFSTLWDKIADIESDDFEVPGLEQA